MLTQSKRLKLRKPKVPPLRKRWELVMAYWDRHPPVALHSYIWPQEHKDTYYKWRMNFASKVMGVEI